MRKAFLTISLLSIVLFSGCAYYNTFYNAQKFYEEAEQERKRREKTQVVELSAEEEEQLRRSGRSAADQKNRASQQEMQNYQQAIERASRVLEYYPESRWVDDALMLLGQCFYYRRDYKKGMRKFDELLQLYPNSDFVPEARLFKARTFLGLEEFDSAEELLRIITTDDDVPKKVRELAKYELGGLYFQKENYALAAENYRSSARSADDKLIKAMAQYRLGDCLVRLEQYEEAPDVFRRAVRAAPNEDFRSQAMFKLGQSYSLNGDYDRAIKTFRDALSKEFEEKRIPRLKLELAENLRLKGDLEEALKWYDNIIQEHKRTDASARAYFALGEIEEYISEDYKKAKENYDLVRSEFSNSVVAPIAQERSDNIATLLDLRNEIARLEGREVEADSLENGDDVEARDRRDDGPIDLSMDGMWVNYTGRDRPPPLTLRDLSETDRQRQARMQERVAEMMAAGDSTAIDSSLLASTQLDSAALAKQRAEEEKNKEFTLSGKFLSLAEVLLFSFDKPDSAIKYYQLVVERHVDTTQTARALYSLSYVYRDVLRDTVLADRVLQELIDLFPESRHAEGARKMLGLPLMADKVDSAAVLYQQGEAALFQQDDINKAFDFWDQVVESYPSSEYAQKAAYAKAWHYENTLFNLDDAIAMYEQLMEQYPESPYVEKIKPKLAAVEQLRKEEEARQKAIADSLAKLEAVKADSVQADSLTQAALIDSVQADSLTQAEADSLLELPETTDSPTDSAEVDSAQIQPPHQVDTPESESLPPNEPGQATEPEAVNPQPGERQEPQLQSTPPAENPNEEAPNSPPSSGPELK